MTDRINFTHPLVFFSLMGIFSFLSYRIEHILGIGAAIVFVIWATATIYAFDSIKKKQLSYNHPATFFILMTTFTLTGYYIQATLNIETFILMVIWLVVSYFTLIWLKRNRQSEQQLSYLLAAQFIAIAIVMPMLLNYMNLEQFCEQTITTHALPHETPVTINEALLNSIENVMLWGSLIISYYALQVGRKTKIILDTSRS